MLKGEWLMKDFKCNNQGETLAIEIADIKIQTTKNDLTTWLTNPYIKAATAENTRIAYRSDVRHFERWGGLLPASSESVIKYLLFYATQLNAKTLARRVTALRNWHNYQNFTDPTLHPAVKKTLIGMQRVHGKPAIKAHALNIDELVRIITPLEKIGTLAAIRDNAILQLGYLGELRRSEIVAIRHEHISWVDNGIEILIPVSKTDQERGGQYCALPYGTLPLCPITALKAWLVHSKIETKEIFRRITKGDQLQKTSLSAHAIGLILKKRAKEVGLCDIALLSSHSLRRGMATSASYTNAELSSQKQHGRWKKTDTLLGYIDAANRFRDNPASHVINSWKESIAKKK
jgi:site-specific recombinase XerD